jgi:hypothetical protein
VFELPRDGGDPTLVDPSVHVLRIVRLENNVYYTQSCPETATEVVFLDNGLIRKGERSYNLRPSRRNLTPSRVSNARFMMS